MAAKEEKRKRGRPRKVIEEPPKKRGRPPGTKNKPKIKTTEELLEDDEPNGPVKKPVPWQFVGKNFQPGKSGNPEGARAHHKEKKMFRAATDKEFAELMQLLINGDITALQEISDEAKTPTGKFSVMQVMTARVALKIIATGNAEAWEKFLTRTYGKPKENISLDLKSLSELKGRVTVHMPSNGREVKS